MANNTVTVNVVVDAKIFHQFFVFENFHRRRGLFKLIIFAGMLTAFSCVCFIIEGGALLGGVLLGVGLGYPAIHIWRIFHSIKTQIRVLDLDSPKTVYTVLLSDSPDGVVVTNHGGGDEPLRYEWGSLDHAYRLKGCVYLYVHADKAFLLPDGQAEEGEEALWSLVTRMLPPEKARDRR